MKPTPYIWQNGQFIPWENATTHVLSHALHYGTAVFEGIRAYNTEQGPAIFRADEHYQRLIDSGKIHLMELPYSKPDMINATKTLIKKNNLDSCYIRPLVYRGYGKMGLNPLENPLETIIAAWEWGTYLGEEGLEKGIRCKMSSWTRIDSRMMPPLAKTSANYVNSALAKIEATQSGYDEAIMLNANGTIAEGPGENLFLIKNGTIYTPPTSDQALSGITCQSIIQIAKDMDLDIQSRSLIRDELFLADELFFTGTAAEVTPIREVDNRIIGSGKRGPITEKLQTTFFEIVKGQHPDYHKWLSFVEQPTKTLQS